MSLGNPGCSHEEAGMRLAHEYSSLANLEHIAETVNNLRDRDGYRASKLRVRDQIDDNLILHRMECEQADMEPVEDRR